jgi:hypothetical protein
MQTAWAHFKDMPVFVPDSMTGMRGSQPEYPENELLGFHRDL